MAGLGRKADVPHAETIPEFNPYPGLRRAGKMNGTNLCPRLSVQRSIRQPHIFAFRHEDREIFSRGIPRRAGRVTMSKLWAADQRIGPSSPRLDLGLKCRFPEFGEFGFDELPRRIEAVEEIIERRQDSVHDIAEIIHQLDDAR